MSEHKTIWQIYGKYLVFGVILLLAAYGGWQYTVHQKTKHAQLASEHYDQLLGALRGKNAKQAETHANTLARHYEKTPYAPLAALLLARLHLENNRMDQAIEWLRTSIQLAEKNPGTVEHIARVRLARVLLSQKKLDEALDVLQTKSSNEGYATLYEEVKGDIYVLKKDLIKAKQAYAAALQAAPPGVSVTALQLKQSDLNTREAL